MMGGEDHPGGAGGAGGAEQAAAFFRCILDALPAEIVVLDGAGRIVAVNEAWRSTARRCGVSLDVCGVGAEYLKACRDDDPSAREAMRGIGEVLAGRKPGFGMEYPCPAPQGDRWFEMWVRALDCGGRRYVIVAHLDVSDRKRVELDLRDSRNMLRLILDTIPVSVFWKDLDCVYRGCNRVFAEKAGLTDPDQIVGKRDVDLPWEEEAPLYTADDRLVMETGEPKLRFEEPQTTADGEHTWLSTTKIPLRDRSGAICGVLGAYEDITKRKEAERERRRLEAQVHHAQKLESLGVLAGGVAHDFNNLLVSILGHADLAIGELSETAPALAYVREIKKASIRASELTNQMLAYSGKGRFVIEPLDLNVLVREMADLLAVTISKKAELVYAFSAAPVVVEGDRAQLTQVVMNLVVNASEALGESVGSITIRTGVAEVGPRDPAVTGVEKVLPPGRYAFLEVADTGCGMDAETRKNLFDPFFTTKFAGRGLGLAATLGAVRGHHGGVRVTSEVGRGSSFTVLLPESRKAPASAEAAPAEAAEAEAGGAVVLVVDDEAGVRKVVKAMLEKHGFGVLTAGDGVEGVEVFRAHAEEISAVVLDMTMPRMSGDEAFAVMRSIRPEVKVILASGYNEQDATSRFEGMGLAGFIQKPFQMDALVAKVRRAIRGPSCDRSRA